MLINAEMTCHCTIAQFWTPNNIYEADENPVNFSPQEDFGLKKEEFCPFYIDKMTSTDC